MGRNEMHPPDPNDGWDGMDAALEASLKQQTKPPPIEWEGMEEALKASLQDTTTTTTDPTSSSAADECEKKPAAKPYHQKMQLISPHGDANHHTMKSPDGVVSMDTDNFEPIKNPDVKSEHSPPPVRRHKNPSSVFDDAGPVVDPYKKELVPSAKSSGVAVGPGPGFFWDPYKNNFVPRANYAGTTAAGSTQHMLTGTASLPRKPATADHVAMPPKVPPQKLANAAPPPMKAPNLPAIYPPPTNKAKKQQRWLLSRKKKIPLDQLSEGVKPFEGGNDDPKLLSEVFGIDQNLLQLGLDDITSRKAKDDIDFADLTEIARMARTSSTTSTITRRIDVSPPQPTRQPTFGQYNLQSPSIGHGRTPSSYTSTGMSRRRLQGLIDHQKALDEKLYVPTPEKVAAMRDAIDGLNIQYNDFPNCKCCGKPAVTSKRAKPGDTKTGPGSHPLDYCMPCGKKELGADCLKNPAVCLCGEERYPDCSECETCRRNAPCRVDDCDRGGGGNTHPHRGVCLFHHNLAQRMRHFEQKDVQKCIRCGKDLFGHFSVHGNSGAGKDICTRQHCANKCVIQDDNGKWCENDRAKAGRCVYHHSQFRKAMYDGTLKRTVFRWTKKEDALLKKLIEEHRRNDAKKTIDWAAVEREFNKEFTRTKKQMQNRVFEWKKMEKAKKG